MFIAYGGYAFFSLYLKCDAHGAHYLKQIKMTQKNEAMHETVPTLSRIRGSINAKKAAIRSCRWTGVNGGIQEFILRRIRPI